ncbi:MAG: hypothetical protein JRJ31_20145, partial [Deltaproteobacteria bacterium]|nr:hypothetical protein [Deltaproteobacteria bacterium]
MRDIGGVLDRMAAGDLKARVTNDYKGDYNVLKVACNELGVQIELLGQEMDKMAVAAGEGDLDYRGDAGKFKGDLAEIVNGVNRTMEGIVRPIKEVMGVLESVANRGLTKRVVGDYRGDYQRLKESTNTAIENLHEALGQVVVSSDQVGAAAGQVAEASQSLAEGASEQAASLEETSASLEQISSMVKQNADNANQANNLVKESIQFIGKANESMGELTSSMGEISKASEETQKIIKTIDEIAFQTNLLALNAAVEAARAGEAGAGFAVVADEVRNLAMRAADAAKNTAGLIEGTVKKVKAGSDIVEKTAGEFSEIAASAAKVSELVSEITAASQEQAQGIEQVNKAVAEMDKVTQQNASAAEESASAAEEMSAQAQELNAMLGQFTLNGRGEGGRHLGMVGSAGKVGGTKKAVGFRKKSEGRDHPEVVIPLKDEEASEEAEFKQL